MPNTAEIIVDTLREWDVEVVFGLPGDGINGVMEALRKRRNEIRFVQVRHEATAAFMASAYAKWTGKLGVCLATSGPGGTNLLTGLYDAKLDQAPVLAITGMQFHDLIETFTQQDVNLVRVFEDVATYNVQISDAAHAQNVVSLACRSAITKPGVAHISIANDIQEQDLLSSHRSKRNRPDHVSNTFFAPYFAAPPEEIHKAASILNKATKPAILIGSGARNAATQVIELAKCLGAPIVKSLLGKDVVADAHPHVTGGIGILGTTASQFVMENCDALLIVGSTFPYVEYYPPADQAKFIQIDINAQRIGLRCNIDVGLVGDAKTTISSLLPNIHYHQDLSFLKQAQDRAVHWSSMLEALEADNSFPLKPQVVVAAFGKLIPSNAILVADSGQNTELCARHIDLKEGSRFGVSGALASMACGLPYALAAAIAFPDKPVFAIIGDGGLAMQLGEFATAVKYNLPLKILVVKNGMLNQIAWEQMMFLGNIPYGCELPDIDFAKAAEAMGGKGYSISRPDHIRDNLGEALSQSGAAIIQATVDPYEPLLPPKMPPDHRDNFDRALQQTKGSEEIRANIKRWPLSEMYTPPDQNF
jgi:pyruvate dehydrogenase (quinone)